MISIKNLEISYTKDKIIINDLNLELKENKIHGIVGLNSSGKTTLLNSVFGLKKQSKGEILINGQKASKKEIAYLTSENYFYKNITAREYLNIFKSDDFNIEKWNELFELPLDNIIDNFSTGMKKKLAIMGVLKQNKPIMILDEPFNGLDIESVRTVRSILLKLKQNNKTIIITSHIIETLTNLCDHIHYLESGKIKFSKEKSEFEDFENEIFEFIENKNKDLIDNLIS